MTRPNEILLSRIDEVRSLVTKGLPKLQIATDLGFSYKTFCAFCVRNSIFGERFPRRSTPRILRIIWTPEKNAELEAMFNAGDTYQKMGAKFKISNTSIASQLRRLGLIRLNERRTVEPQESKDPAYIFPLPWYDFKAWSRGAQPGQRFIYSIGSHQSERLDLLMLAMRRDESVILTRDDDGRCWCEKVEITHKQEMVA